MQFKKLNALALAVMMAVMPTLQAEANTVTIQSAINQLNYTLSVEWDQKDPAVKRMALETFTAQVAELQKNGLSNEAIVEALKAQMPDAQTAKDIENLAAQAKAEGLSNAEMNKLVAQYMQNGKVTGASWSDAATYTVISIAVIALIIVVLASGGTVTVSSTGYWTVCEDWDYYYGWYYYDCYVYY